MIWLVGRSSRARREAMHNPSNYLEDYGVVQITDYIAGTFKQPAGMTLPMRPSVTLLRRARWCEVLRENARRCEGFLNVPTKWFWWFQARVSGSEGQIRRGALRDDAK